MRLEQGLLAAGDAMRTVEALGSGDKGRYLLAATFGNVHGVYKPGNVKLRPEILKEIQDAVGAKYGKEKPFDLVFHGGSGSLLSEIHGALDFGVVKMNIDTDTQYAFTRPVAAHMFTNYDGVLKVDGEVGSKKAYDPRAWGKAAEAGMAARVVEACENLQIAEELLAEAAAAKIILEIEVGVVGGEEDGVSAAIDDKLYSTVEALGTGERGRYMTALTFGNVHGAYKPGHVKLRPEILKLAQDAVADKLGLEAGSRPFDLVFHGGSGSLPEEIQEAISYGVVKMNIDTDTQYAYTRPIADHMFRNYDGVLKVDGEIGSKKAYDPRAWGRAGEAGMATRVLEACENLRSTGQKV